MKYFTLLSLVVAFCSCSVYSTNTVHLTGFEDKGQLAISGAAGYGINLQLAYAVTNNFGSMANYMNNTQTVKINEITKKGSGNLIELGASNFYKGDSKMKVEVLGGYGLGKIIVAKFIDIDSEKLSTNGHKIFLQPSIVYSTKNSFLTDIFGQFFQFCHYLCLSRSFRC